MLFYQYCNLFMIDAITKTIKNFSKFVFFNDNLDLNSDHSHNVRFV